MAQKALDSVVVCNVSDFTNEWNTAALAYAWRYRIPQRILEERERGTVHLSDFNSEWNKQALERVWKERERKYAEQSTPPSIFKRIYDFLRNI